MAAHGRQKVFVLTPPCPDCDEATTSEPRSVGGETKCNACWKYEKDNGCRRALWQLTRGPYGPFNKDQHKRTIEAMNCTRTKEKLRSMNKEWRQAFEAWTREQHGLGKPSFGPRDKVEAKWKDGKWYAAIIVAVDEKNKYTVQYEADQVVEASLPERRVRARPTASPATAPSPRVGEAYQADVPPWTGPPSAEVQRAEVQRMAVRRAEAQTFLVRQLANSVLVRATTLLRQGRRYWRLVRYKCRKGVTIRIRVALVEALQQVARRTLEGAPQWAKWTWDELEGPIVVEMARRLRVEGAARADEAARALVTLSGQKRQREGGGNGKVRPTKRERHQRQQHQ